MNESPQENALFVELVLVFQQSAWIALGKIQNPHTGKTEVDLQGASHAIDMLDMMVTKMKGNLSAGEKGLLDNALTQLRLNYVEVASGDSGEPDQSAPEVDDSPNPGSGSEQAT
jgi:hypothetical protein